MSYLLLVIGFILLIKGADFFVDGATFIANKFKIPPIVIGMTIVAIGTSLPEITISVLASFKGSNGMAIGNILGSNILNICLVLGLVACFSAVPVKKQTIKIDIPFLIILEVILLVLGLIRGSLSRLDGVILCVLFIGFTLYIIKSSKGQPAEEIEAKDLKVWQVILYLVGGCVAIKFGGDFIVDSATTIAKQFGMSDNLIGLTIVALGTSLPELVTSVVAARKGQVDLALGNVIGSDIFNILIALMLSAIVNPLTYTFENIVDNIVAILIAIFTFIFAYTDKQIKKLEGASLLLIYVVYAVYIFLR